MTAFQDYNSVTGPHPNFYLSLPMSLEAVVSFLPLCLSLLFYSHCWKQQEEVQGWWRET